MACQLGPDRIVLSKARMLPRDYLLLVEELTISSDVSLPDVVVTGKLGAGGLVGRTKAATMSGGDKGDPKNAGDEHEDGATARWATGYDDDGNNDGGGLQRQRGRWQWRNKRR